MTVVVVLAGIVPPGHSVACIVNTSGGRVRVGGGPGPVVVAVDTLRNVALGPVAFCVEWDGEAHC